MIDLPTYIPTLMIACAFFSVYMLYKAAHNNTLILWIISAWLLLQGAVSLTGFYYTDFSLPPRFLLMVLPPLILIIALFNNKRGKNFLDGLSLKTLTWLHIVRVPVEICLFWLYQHGQIPVEMTFEGRNFDIPAGLTAPLVAWLAFPPNAAPRRGLLLVWNFVSLALLFNIVGTAVAAGPYFGKGFGFETINLGLFYFPFVWLPCLIVPVVLLAHLVLIRRLLAQNEVANY